jgi:hypothetical protein
VTLAKDTGRLGLWRNPDPSVKRGVHALVVGISDYPFLAGGTHAVPKPMGMGQLVLSAATAAQIFAWLRTSGRLAGRPVASCRLLLAPGQSAPAGAPSESEFVEGLTDGWFESPDFGPISAAVVEWANEFYQAAAHESAQNAAFFFFSGHGLQVLSQPSLLARDILDPGSVLGPKNAVAYRSILDSLPTYGLGDGLFLFDCCRNGPEAAQKFNMVGRPVLEPLPSEATAPRSMKYLAATEGEGRAYQDPDSPRRATLFGQAVLEALEGVEPGYRPYDLESTPWRLMFEGLESYARGRVTELLIQRQANKTQKVASGGEASEQAILVAERDPPAGFDPRALASPPPEFAAASGSNPTDKAQHDPTTSLQGLLDRVPRGMNVVQGGAGGVEL